MNINVNEIMNYVTYALIAFGLMAFVVSLIVQAIKDLPCASALTAQTGARG